MVTSDLTGFRLSPQQEHLWRAQGSRPAHGFVCQGLLEVRGPLDRDRLRRAVERVVERHEILRTAFPSLPGMGLPVQVIQERGRVLWNEPEASEPGEAGIERLLAEARRLAFPLEDGTSLQASLVSWGEERHTLLVTLPGLVADALSLHILAGEIAALYAGVAGAEDLDSLQYADAAESLQEWLGPEDGPGAAFWRQQSGPAHNAADPTEPAVPETASRRLPADAVTGLADQLEVSVPLLLLAGWTAALWWETGENRRTIAVAFDGRTVDELLQAVGPYTRYLPLPCTAGPGITLGELARGLEGSMATAASWQDAFSPDRLAAGPAGEGSAPLWPFGFDSHRTAVLSPALSLRPAFVGLGRFGLRLSVIEDGTEALLDLHYDPSLAGRLRAERLLDRVERVLAAAAARDVPLGEMDVLTEVERREILVDFNATAAPYPATVTASDLFEERVRLAPQALAVAAAGEASLTFGELDARANRLARHLRELGIGPESRVGIHLEREPEMVVTLLAVLKAGGAYVPFDTGHPTERLRFLLEDAGLAALVTRERLRPAGAETIPTILIDADGADSEAISRQDDSPPPRLAGPGNAAYVIYTSGSTGRPKGVIVTHRGLVNYLWWARTAYAAGPERGAPVHSSLGFDLTVTSLFVPLLAGAAITLLPEEDGIGALAEALREESRFGLAKITPAHLGLLRQLTPEGEPPPSAGCLVIGGDALWGADIAPWRRHGTRIFNEYGPTETVVGCCVHEVDPESQETGAVPIGRPIANTRLYVMGRGLRPVPAGAPGELWIGGDGVARGYLGRPDLTAERFVPDPFAAPDQAGGRLYRTGDLVRLSSPGAGLEFLGRIDDQVKIRGHRIEPGEVAVALAAHPGLRDAAVAPRGAGDDRRLVAWVVARDRARRPSAAELRGFLAERLPAPMIPAAFVPLDVLPLTANGKLDRRALPDPDHQRDEETPYAAPRTPIEEALAGIWCQVLGVDRVGIDDHFFSLGGDSIRTLQVLILAQKRGLAVAPQELFQRPTIRALAERVSLVEGEGETVAASAPFSLLAPADRARLPQGIEDAYPLASLQAGMLFHSELDPESAVYHDQHSFHVQASFSAERMREAVDQISLLHPVLRTSFDLASYSESLQLVHSGVRLPVEVYDLRQVPAEEQEAAVAEWLSQERLRAFDWTRPPLVELHVHVRDEGSFQFTMSFHHAVLDGWSAASLLTELFRRYATLLRGEEPPPDVSLAVTYRDFVALERAAAASAEARGFWSRMLDGAEPTRLPHTSWPETAEPQGGAREIHTPLDRELSEAAKKVAREAEVPLKSLLLAVHLKVAGVLGGARDVLTGLVSHGRPEHADGERVLGLFLNTLPLRAHLRGGTWRELVQEVFALEREMLPFRHFPLAEMRGLESGRQRLETAFNYLHYHVYKRAEDVHDIEVVGHQGYEETNFPLITHATLEPFSQNLQWVVAYRPSDLEAGEAERFSAYLLRALVTLVEAPSSRYDAAVLLSAAELAQVLDGAAGRHEPLPVEPIHRRFERQASRAPEATALVWEGRRTSYGELEAAANRMARHLRSLGVGPEVRVAVLLERSTELIVTLLAILKAGGAYLPLDPAYPAERSAFILADSAASVLITEERLSRSLSASTLQIARLVRIDADRDRIEARPAVRLAGEIEPANTAYVIYTSGSTGNPKGAQVTHANVSRLFTATEERFGFGPGDVWTLFHSVAFDFSVWEIWGALLYGGRLVVVPHQVTRSPEDFHALLAAESVTVLNQTPSAFQQLAAWEQGAAAPRELSLRLVIFGGEALNLASLRGWFERHGDVRPRLVNMYGITETTVHVTVRPVSAADLERGGSPIGGPVADLRLSLLAAEGTLAPVGVPGEIHVGGAGLARGYLERPALTAERFVPDPFGGGAGERLYRSGDLARRHPDGSLEYLGRIDHQVKIRGFRIELGEIEAALAAIAGVREAVVVAREDRSAGGTGGLRLVAYLAGEISADALRQSLRERLPDYMVPAAFVSLPELPLTPNGKVDRKALPAPEGQGGREDHLAPRTPVEEVLAGVWAELLGLDRVGATDSFFDLGGHSLLATRVMSRLRAAFGVEMPLRDLFEAPVLADLAVRVEMALRAGDVATAPPLVPVPREGLLPLSFSQQRLWFIDQLEPGSPLYNIPTALRVEGPLDGAVLALCLGEIVRRHEVLRTVFAATEGSPVQVIQPAEPFRLPVVDLSELPESAREALVLGLTGEEAARPFDLGDPRGGPLLRCVLLRLAEGDHVVALTMHHVASDGWSMGILVREIAALYPAFAAGQPSPLPELPVQYADFAVWQHSWLHGELLENEIAWWRRQLAGLPPLLELPTDRPRPAVQSSRGATRPVRLPAGLTGRMEALARREGATLFMVLLAGFQALLARSSGQDDLAVGTPVAGRNRVEIEGLIGFFINTLVIRGGLSAEPTFGELLGQVRESALAAYLHQDVPFEKLVEELALHRSLAHTPLFQVMLVLNVPLESLEIRDLRLRPVSLEGTTAKLDLTIHLSEHEGGLAGTAGYATDLYDAATIDRLIRHYERLLTAVAATPELPASAVPLLSEAEQDEIVREALQEARPVPTPGPCVHELFAAQVARTPEALAVVDEEGAWTYAELGRRVRRLAQWLRAAGVGPDQPVILCAGRNAGQVTGLLGILEAGGAYLAVEPDLPRVRLELIAQDAQARVAVTERRLADALPAGLQRIFLDALDELDALDAETRVRPAVTPGHLAYVLYTSGSTGRPKGVMVEHRQLTAYVQGVLERLAPPPGASFATVTSFSADLGHTSIFPALLGGGCLHVVARERLADAEAFAERMERRPVDVLKIVPSHLAALLTAERPERSLPRHLLVLGGEPLPWSLIDRVRALAPECRLFNHYGPTETTVGVLAGRVETVEVETDAARANASAPLGRPLGATSTWVVDRHFQLVPAGLPGELCAGGPQVTRGYLGRPDLTAERFVPDPFSGRAGERLYRTGDLFRRRPGGPFEFLGRIDAQVKIRGFRIELGEIEAALVSLPGVREAAVLAHEDRSGQGPGGRRLVAYVVGDAAAEELRRSLRERLPDYMVPTVVVKLAALPLTPNGKVDRKALPAPEPERSARIYRPARTPVEEVLCGIWTELLGLERVGIDEDFFDLGGHSLLATRVMSRLRAAFSVEMPLRDLFAAPRLADLATRVEALQRSGTVPPAPPLLPVPRQGPPPLSFSQQRLWFIDQLEPGSPLYNMPAALRVEGPLDGAVLARCYGEIVRRHEALRTAFTAAEGSPVQVIQAPAPFRLPVVDLSGLPEGAREALSGVLMAEEIARPFDLTRGLLLRGMLVRLAAEEHAVTLTMHHIVSDGWSIGILVREIAALYEAFAAGRPSPLPELPVQYADFAAWQSSWLRGEVLEQEIAWWRRQLAGLPLLELPTDRPRPAAQSFRGAHRPLRLPAGLARQAEALGRREGATLFMVLLAGFQALLARHSGQDDLAVGSPVAGRNRVEVEGLIGFFVNTLVLRGDLGGDPSFRELLGRARETALAAHTHQDVPFEKLVEDLAPKRSLAQTPLFQVVLALQNAPADRLEIQDLRLRPVHVAGTTAKFDLTMSLAVHDGELGGTVEYATDLFDAATIDRLLGHFERLLAAAVAEPDLRAAELPLLSAAELHQLMDWGGRRTRCAAASTLHGRFAARARLTPEAPALTCGDLTLSYGELDRRSSQLARWLRRHGADLESRVGLCLDRSLDLVVGILGVLKAGAAYVPLDPGSPRERLAYILEDADIRIVVTTGELAAVLPDMVRQIHLDADRESLEQLPAGDLADLTDEASLAYVIYTSGSTGRPKGALITHGNVSRLFAATEPWFGFGERDVWTLFHSYAFDFSVWEIWGALLHGGRLVIVPWEVSRSPGLFLDLLHHERVTVLNQTPSAFAQLARADAEHGDSGDAATALRLVIFGGEALDPASLEPWLTRHGDTQPRLVNMYGITETTVHVTWRPFSAADARSGQRSVIGVPIADLSLAVVDRSLRPVPIGVPGELVIGGAGLARGYLGRPGLTAERFIPDPAGGPGERLYRSGDLGRFLPDGDVEYLGRLDHQVKIRGFRIELGEIEAALVRLPGVREAVVMAREDGEPGARRLVAYVVGDASSETLRGALRERLPDYMVPAAFVTLAALPLTPNGKVDRKALPAPEQTGARDGYVAPRTREEEILAAVWAQVLRLPRVGVNDNFFELGGDSILSVQIAARARQAGLLFTVRQVFEHQTVAELARHATAADAAGARAGQGPVAGEVPLTPIQRWFFAQGFADSHHFNQALLLEPREPLSPAALERAMAALVEHHDALRMRFHTEGDWRQENAPAEPVPPFHRVDLSSLPVPRLIEASEQAAAALQAGFDLSAGPLTRLCLFNAGAEQPERLLWITHHLVVDGVSWRVLLEDLEGAYRQAASGQRVALPPKTTSFRQWAHRLTEHAGSDALARELEVWSETARASVPRLPVDFPEDGNLIDLIGDAAAVSFELSAEETADLLQTLPAVYHSRINDALLSALVRALAGWSGSPRLRVDLEGHGREPLFDDLDVSRTVGWFTTLYPVVLEAGDAGPGDALVSAKERLRAVPGRGIGYGLVRHLLTTAPAAEILFNYLGQVDATFDERSLFQVSGASAGPVRSPRAHRTHRLEISGIVAQGRLRINLTYGSRTHRRETAERLAAAYAGALRELIRHGRESAEVFTPSDFPKAGLDVRSFNQLAALLSDPVESLAGGLGLTLKNVADVYPLTPLQSGMLFHSLMEPESGVYVNQVTCTLPADLDAGLFRQAWERLVARHGVLRTAFLWEGLDEPRQVVRKNVSLHWQELDWRGLSAEEQQRRFEELRHRDRHTPLPLDRAPLMRFSLVRLGGEHGFIWTAHHLLMDGWSIPLLVQELGSVYAALRDGREPELPPTRPFSDYMVWLQKQDPELAEPFWRGELAGFTAPNSLGIAPRAGTMRTAASGHAEHRSRISREVTAGLQALAARHKLTLQTLTLGAWAVLVSRYSREEDVVFGGVVSGRPADLPGVETMIGLFINTLPVRARVHGAELLAPWLQRLQERQLTRRELEHSPLGQIQRWSEVPAGSPLFETLYVFENYPTPEGAEGDGADSLRISNLRSFETTNYPVTLTLAAADQIALHLMYDPAQVDADAAPRLLHHFATLLAAMAAMVEGPPRVLDDLSLLTAEEALQLRAGEQGDPTATYPLDRPLHAWIEDQADRSPGAVAVTFENEELTYGELDRRANRLARHLRALGVGPETRVAVLMERSTELVVALLAIFKAGGAYVPLDLAYPAERIAFLLADSAATVLLTEGQLAEALPPFPGEIVRIDADRERIAALPAERLEGAGGPAHLAYVIYTSGSTGRPKGVQVTHANALRLFAATQERFGFGPADVWTFFHSVAFDFSVWEIWGALLYGGRLVIVPHEVSRSPWMFLDLLVREQVTVLNQTPSAFTQLAQEDEKRGGVATDLRLVIFGGEALDLAGLSPWFARHGDEKPLLVNMYGITETTVHVTARPVRAVDAREETRSLIGLPIPDLSLTLVDPGLRPVPRGVPGELAVGGAGLARGYLGRPELTAERFVPDPLGGSPGARLYRSGDLGRRLSNGDVEYLGRIDHQVKIRGFRIELGEIEAALAAHPKVREAVVVARDGLHPGSRRLVAYLVIDGEADGEAPPVDELRRTVGERLPDYMVPAAFVMLESFPLTPHGKVDRKALPAPEQPASRGGYVAPRTREEEILAAVWAQVLRLPRVGVNDNFFELGGDSILSIQIVARARQAGLLCTVRQVFEHQTVADLARHATAAVPPAAGQGPVAGEVPLTPIQHWFFEQGLADPHHFNQALLLESEEPLSPAALERAMAALVEHHDALRMRFTGGWRQENAAAEPVAPFHRVDLSSLPAPRLEEAFARAAASLQAGFDLAAGPLTRLCLFHAPPTDTEQTERLLWITHHLVVDGVSWRVLVEDLEGAYRQAAGGLRVTLPPKTTSFQQWALRLAGHAGSDAVARELEDWLETARAPVPRLPVDFPEESNLVDDAASVSFELGAEETADLLQTLPAVYHSRIDDALLSALVRALAGWSGSPRLRVDLEGHGREPLFDDLDVSRTVGWFTTLYPVVLEAGDAGPGDALVSAKERLRAVPGRGIGYGLLRHLGAASANGGGEAARLLQAAPAAEISFNYLGQVHAHSGARSLLRASSASAGLTRSPRAQRTHPLDVNAIVAEGRLRISLTYGSRTYRRETAERLASAYAGALRELIQHGRQSAEVFTPSDFPKAGLDVRSFNQLAALLSDPAEPIESFAGGLGLTLKNVADVYPLTPLQNGMLFHSLMAPESGVYVNQITCTLAADLDARLFRQTWERLIEHHGALRTAFLWDGLDEPRQAVRKHVSLHWQELDWRGLSAEEQQRRFEELRHRDRHTPLPLDQAPLMRFSLVRLDREHGFIWTAHHLLMDGWSRPLLVQELGSVYAALREGREPELPPARPFSDYIVWLQKQDASRAEPFWREELAGFTAPNSLGIAAPAGSAEAAGSAERKIWLSREVTEKLQTLAARHKVTMQIVTLGAWAVLVSRYSSEEDVVFGTVISGRPAALPGVETMIGMFINTLPVRVRVDGAALLAPWLQRLQERQLARQDFEHSPLGQIQRWSAVPAGSPLFETLYIFENYPISRESGPEGLRIGNLRSIESTNYPLTLTITAAEQIAPQLMYDRAHIEEEAVLRLLQQFATLLTAMAERPEALLDDLGLLTAEETLQLRAWNETATPYPLDRPLHAWIEDQAARTPDAVALVFEAEELTYGELDRRADRLARRLQARGCGPESRVGVLLERSCELLVALLGILKAGAAYVPLDPDHPADRLAFQERDARLRLIVTRAGLADRLPGDRAGAGDRFLLLEHGEPAAGDLTDGPLAVDIDPGHPAYVLYTSGSTGRPKGAVIPHRAIVNRLLWMQDALRLSAADRVLQKTPFSFDVSVWELFWPLMTGARLVVALPGGHRDNASLARLIAGQGITVLHFVPSMLQLFLEEPGVAECHTLRDVVCSGEALPTELARRFAARLGHARLHNLYGPTEAAVDVTSWVCAADGTDDGRGGIPIGRPIANTRIHLLGRGLLPVPAGAPGELFIAGVNLARGYVERPDLTAERFLPDPEGREPGGRVYRTGDLARWRADGAIEYLGRLDHQVKIRGFRIELGEIEATLAAHPGVREAIVVARDDGAPGDRRLVAYLVAEAEAPPVEELRRAVGARLPDYMVPAAFVVLESFPLTPNGKVDRKALPAPERQGSAETSLAPRTPVEEVLCGIWAEVLGLDQVGVGDHFFELGGHSLLATQVLSRLRGAFGIEMPLHELFAAPRLTDLAARVEEVRRAGTMAPAPPLLPVPREGALPLSFAQQRLWFIDQLEAGSAQYNMPVALRVEGPLDAGVLALTLGEIVRRHEALRTVFAEAAGSPFQVIRPAGPFSLAVVDLSGLPESAREPLALALAREEGGRPFDLARGPLLRGTLLRLAAGSHIAALTLHHIAGDGWSMGILVREVTTLYQAFLEEKPSPLPELPVQYADFAVWQRGWLDHEVLERLVGYWRQRLAGAPPQLDLPGARPRPAALSPRGSARKRRFSPPLLAQLRALGRRESATLFMTLLAPLQALLHARTGATDLVVGTDVAGRDRREVEGLIGFFINQLPLRTHLAGDPALRELLKRVRDTALEAYAHQDLPFNLLVEALPVEQSLRRSPVFQVKLVLQNTPQEDLDLPDLSFEVVGSQTETAQLDLHWGFVERGDELWMSLTYSTDLYDEALIDSLLDQYEMWLHAFAERPEARLGAVAAEIAQAAQDQLAERGMEIKSKNFGKLRGRRRQAEELQEV
jgi:amino acid adenylation domain-containing protein/non-ribosomal peptide synthase protein (TIGR01720 family)